MAHFFIKTYGCAQNTADSQRIKTYFHQKGQKETKDWKKADTVIINTCIIRESAENRAYGLLENIHQHRLKNKTHQKIIITGCLVGSALRQKNKNGLSKLTSLKKKLPQVDQFLPIEKISFSLTPLRDKKESALIPISSGCNNFCSYCIVPFARGKEISRPFKKIVTECQQAIADGFTHLTLVGQNVNSYGSDLVKKKNSYLLPSGQTVRPVLVKSMGKSRIPTLFPYLLDIIAALPGLKTLSFISSNPWDFSDQLIKVIQKNKNIDRLLHLPVQSGDNHILKLMNRNYTSQEYLDLVKKIKKAIPDIKISTDIIIGFPQEDETAFQNTVRLCQQSGFVKAYLNKYSPRLGTISQKLYPQTVSQKEKRRRWHLLHQLINQPQMLKSKHL
jgi:tRNA-2-methylthio-N6-dimethylallyladenosine synthase